MSDIKRKRTLAYKRQQARLRQAQKRTADREIKAPSMAQITTAFGHAVRAAIAAERGSAGYRASRQLSSHWRDIIVDTQDRLRESGFAISEVTVSRLEAAISPDAYITSSFGTPEITG